MASASPQVIAQSTFLAQKAFFFRLIRIKSKLSSDVWTLPRGAAGASGSVTLALLSVNATETSGQLKTDDVVK